MTQTARVTKIEGLQAFITYREPEGAKARSSRSFWKVREAEFPARIPEGLQLEPGDFIEIYVEPGKTVLSAFQVLLFPLLLFPLFYFVSGLISGGRLAEGFKGLAGLGGVAAGFGINLVIAVMARRRGREWNPVITRKITREEMCADSPKKDCASCGICT